MKFKKIIALSACAMMALSTVANASYTKDEDGWYIATEVTKAQVENFAPKATIDVTELDAAGAKAAGLALGKGASALTDANSDFYKIDLTLSDLGDLMYAYLDGSDYAEEMQIRIFNANVTLSNIVFKKVATSSTFQDIAWLTSDAGNEDNLFSMYWYAGSDTAAYPTRNPASGDLVGSYIENASMPKATFIIALDEGSEYDITPTLKITYAGQNKTDGQFSANATKGVFPNGNVVLKHKADDPKTMDMTASLKGKYENGYVWEATVTPGDNALAQFNAKFTEAGTGKTAERTVHNPGAMDFSGTGSLTFNVGLRTQKTLSGAEFTAYATADDYKTVAAPVE